MITLILTKQYWLNYQTDNFQFVRDENAGGIIAPPAFLTSYSLPQPIYLPAAHNLPQADDFLLSAVHFWQSLYALAYVTSSACPRQKSTAKNRFEI